MVSIEPDMDGLGAVRLALREVAQLLDDGDLRVVSADTLRATLDGIKAYGLAVHDACCVECHNADMRDRCPRRQQLTRLDGAAEPEAGGSESDEVCRYYP